MGVERDWSNKIATNPSRHSTTINTRSDSYQESAKTMQNMMHFRARVIIIIRACSALEIQMQAQSCVSK